VTDLICTETGALDIQAIKAHALMLARRDYGGLEPPPAFLRRYFSKVWCIALDARAAALKEVRKETVDA